MRWKDIDFRNGVLTIELSKNGEKRHVPLNNHVLRILKARQKRWKSEYVIPSRFLTTPMDAHNFAVRVFNPALKLAGIRDFRFHDLRHAFASRLVMAGVDLRTTQELMGHKCVQMTLRYSHLAPSHLKEAVNRLWQQAPSCPTPSTDSD